MKTYFKENWIWITVIFLLISGLWLSAYTQYKNMQDKLDFYVFETCISGSLNQSDEQRRACVNYSKAYRDKKPYQAFGKTLVWDDTIYKYVVKED